jgi:hypothetical protein
MVLVWQRFSVLQRGALQQKTTLQQRKNLPHFPLVADRPIYQLCDAEITFVVKENSCLVLMTANKKSQMPCANAQLQTVCVARRARPF